MMERFHGEVGRIHAAWRRLAVADACHVEMIDVSFRSGPCEQRAAVGRGHHRDARQMNLVRLALMLDLGAWPERESARAGALSAGQARRERADDNEAQHNPCEDDRKRHEALSPLSELLVVRSSLHWSPQPELD